MSAPFLPREYAEGRGYQKQPIEDKDENVHLSSCWKGVTVSTRGVKKQKEHSGGKECCENTHKENNMKLSNAFNKLAHYYLRS
jgi:hypothetical protein